jgi:hypothetical protein
VTEDMAEPGDGLLRALGRVEPPRPAVLEAAREALWSAVAAEMLATQPPGSPRRASGAVPEHKHRHQDEPGA